MKRFLVPCFIVVDGANTVEEANELADRHIGMKNGSALLIDEELATTEIPSTGEFPHTMKGIVV